MLFKAARLRNRCLFLITEKHEIISRDRVQSYSRVARLQFWDNAQAGVAS